MVLFLLKKLIGQVIMPLGLIQFLLLVGVVLLFRRRKAAGRIVVLAATLLLYLFSLPPVADMLARPLEEAYPVAKAENLPADLGAVVVLGGGALDRRDLPPAARLGGDTLQRTLEGVRLWQARPGARLILCGGEWSDQPDCPTPAELMGRLAESLGVDPKMIRLDQTSKDTHENALEALKLMENKPFVLVTSARHLVRSVAVFRKLGREPIPAPTDHKIRIHGADFSLVPSLGGLNSVQESLHEYFGLAWYWIKGRI